MSVVSSNTVMSEGNLRVAGGWVLLPLVGEPVEVLVPCGGSDLKFAKNFKNLKTLVTFKLFREQRFEDTQPENSIINQPLLFSAHCGKNLAI